MKIHENLIKQPEKKGALASASDYEEAKKPRVDRGTALQLSTRI